MRILYQLTSPMDRTMGPQEVARRQTVLQSHAAAGSEVAVEPSRVRFGVARAGETG